MTSGLVADIRTASLIEGPGPRIAVVLKGCPLSCAWCHNPESLLTRPQRLQMRSGIRLVGHQYDPRSLATVLADQAALLDPGTSADPLAGPDASERQSIVRVTFTGGEPLLQAPFIAETIDLLDRPDVVLDTSGYGREPDLRLLLDRSALVLYDLKLMDPVEHRAHTGASNGRILGNLHILASSGVPYVIRVPVIPGVTDSAANLGSIARRVAGLPGLLRVELIPFDSRAPERHEAVGVPWTLDLGEPRPVAETLAPFLEAGLEARLV